MILLRFLSFLQSLFVGTLKQIYNLNMYNSCNSMSLKQPHCVREQKLSLVLIQNKSLINISLTKYCAHNFGTQALGINEINFGKQ